MGRLVLSCANHEMTHLDIILAMRMGKKFVCLDGEGICAIQQSVKQAVIQCMVLVVFQVNATVTQAGKGNFAMNVGPTQAVLMELAVSHGSATVSRNGVEFFVMKI